MEANTNSGVACPKCGAPLGVSTSNANKGQLLRCTTCRQREWYDKNKDRVKADSKAYYEQTRERRLAVAKATRASLGPAEIKKINRKNGLMRKYGITVQQYDSMFETQRGLCFLCDLPPKESEPLEVDHDHFTGKVRKLLCGRCNTLLHGFEAPIEWQERALQYLNSHKGDCNACIDQGK
jgi:hypothetical protein